MNLVSRAARGRLRRFRSAYGEHRAAEGRKLRDSELLSLPYLTSGPFAREWRVRARTFERFLQAVLQKRAGEVANRPLTVADLGAGNGWLCSQMIQKGHRAAAVDVRADTVDGLGAAATFARTLETMFPRVVASFDAIPFRTQIFDIAVFNASLHYALDLRTVLGEAARITMSGGRVVILDSPFYRRAEAGEAMLQEKRSNRQTQFGDRANDLLDLPFIEYLTRDRMKEASRELGLEWTRHRVWYPLWYETRPLVAAILRRRVPSRFDLWQARVL